MNRVLRVGVAAAMALVVSLGASAQLSKGFRGRVLGMDGKGIAGATVTFVDESNANNHFEVKSDAAGNFVYTGLPYSDNGYEVTAEAPGLPPQIIREKPKLGDITVLTFDPNKGVGFKGTIKDKAGKPTSGAKITIVNLADETKKFTAKSDSQGGYEKTELPFTEKGYSITCEIPGVDPITKPVAVQKIFKGLLVDFDFSDAAQVSQPIGKPASSNAAEAKQLFGMGDFDGALAKANEAIAGDDNVKASKFMKASCLTKLGRKDEAIAAFEDYDKSYPGDPNVLGELFNLYNDKGNKEKADFYKKAYMTKGGQVQGATYNDGVKALNAGEADKAVQLFQQAIKENGTDPDGHRELARAYAQLGKYQESIDELKAYLKMKPNADDAEMWKQAITGLEQAIQPQKKK